MPAFFRLCMRTPCALGPNPVSRRMAWPLSLTNSTLTLKAMTSGEAPAAFKTLVTSSVLPSTPKTEPSFAAAKSASCSANAVSLPMLNLVAAGSTAIGPVVAATPAAAVRMPAARIIDLNSLISHLHPCSFENHSKSGVDDAASRRDSPATQMSPHRLKHLFDKRMYIGCRGMG